MSFPVKEFVKYAVGTALRHLFTIIATIWVVKHYVGADIAQKLMHGDTITLWQGYSFSLSTMVTYVADAFVISILPIALGILMRMRAKLKQRLALWLPEQSVVSGEDKVKELLKATPLTTQIAAVVTMNPLKVLDAAQASGVTTTSVPATSNA